MSHLSNILNPERSRAGSEAAPNSEESTASGNANANEAHQVEYPQLQTRNSYTTYEHAPHPDCPDTLACLPDTDGRPQHTLPVILRCSILGSPRKRLTIREIYQAMEEKYPFYKTAGPTWKQSVRHHLSLNRLFERQPRPVTDPGFGSYWTVNLSAPPGTKRPRKRGRNSTKDGEGAGKSPTEGSPVQPSASTSSAAANHIANNFAPTVGRRRGRPRKASVSSAAGRDETPMSSHLFDERGGDGIMTPLDGPPESDDDYDSGDDGPSGLSFDRRDSLGPLGPATFNDLPQHQHHTRSNMPFQLLPIPDNDDSSEPPHIVIERLREEVGTLRRQSAEAVSVSLRLSEQLAQAQREIERSRLEIRDLEDALQDEQRRRVDAEGRSALNNMRRDPAQMIASQTVVVPNMPLRAPTERPRGPV